MNGSANEGTRNPQVIVEMQECALSVAHAWADRGKVKMYVCIGLFLTIAVAFGSPFFWDSAADPSQYASITNLVSSVLFLGTGWLIDRRIQQNKAKRAATEI